MSCVTASIGDFVFDPVPLISITKNYTRKDNENKLLGDVEIKMTGTLLVNKGINVPSGNLTRINKIRIMQDELRDALNVDRQNLFIVDASGFPILNVFPRVESLNFSEDVWVNKSEYEIVFSVTEEEQNLFVESASDNWETTLNENETRIITHTVSAKGIRGDYGTKTGGTPVSNAKDFVLSKIGADPTIQQFFISAGGFSAFNHTKQESISECNGTYSIIESWILHNNTFTDERSVVTTEEFSSNDESIISINITGTIVGLDPADEPSKDNRLAAAIAGFNSIKGEIGYNAAGVISRSNTTNNVAGTVQYAVSTTSNPIEDITNKTIERTFSRNDDGSTTQTVTMSAEVVSRSNGTIQDIIDFVNINMMAIDSIDPPFSAAGSVQISRGSTRDDTNKTYSQTNEYVDAGNITFREEFTIDATLNDEGFLEVTVAGTIFGLKDESTTSSEERFVNANTGFVGTVESLILTRALTMQSIFSRTLNIKPITKVLGHNPKGGTVTYSQNFNDRPSPPTGIVKQVVTVTDTGGDPIVVQIPIPGRAAGPVFQIMNTITPFQRSISIEWTLEEETSISSADNKAKNVIDGLSPSFIDNDIVPTQTRNFSLDTRKYSRNATWIYNTAGSTFRLNISGES